MVDLGMFLKGPQCTSQEVPVFCTNISREVHFTTSDCLDLWSKSLKGKSLVKRLGGLDFGVKMIGLSILISTMPP